ncbi:MAG: hypothetical protein ACR2KM_08800 [Gemmatimonadaceae bacterium]
MSKPAPVTVSKLGAARALYRAEKAARAERRAGETYWINAWIDAARVGMKDDDTTPGGNAVRRDGTKRNNRRAA